MIDSQTGAIKDKFLAGAAVAILLACYMALTLKGVDTKFIEGAFLIALGAFVGLLKQSPSSPTSAVTSAGDVNVNPQGN